MVTPDKPTYGICHLSIVPVRTDPSDKAEISTQLLFGDIFIMLKYSEDKKWMYIQTAFDDYKGWIDPKQYRAVSEAYFEEYLSTDHPYTTDLISYLHCSKSCIPLVLGSVIPFFANGLTDLGTERMEFKGGLTYPDATPNFKSIEGTARQYLGAPYLWGGKSPFGIDCSGFTQQVFKLSGLKLLRDAWQQAEQGVPVSFDDRRAGDLAFFNNPQGKVVHVGIVLEERYIMHASGEVRVDFLESAGILHKEKNIYTHKFCWMRRFA